MKLVSLLTAANHGVYRGKLYEVITQHPTGDCMVRTDRGTFLLNPSLGNCVLVDERTQGHIEMEDSFKAAISKCESRTNILDNISDLTVRDMFTLLGPEGIRFNKVLGS